MCLLEAHAESTEMDDAIANLLRYIRSQIGRNQVIALKMEQMSLAELRSIPVYVESFCLYIACLINVNVVF